GYKRNIYFQFQQMITDLPETFCAKNRAQLFFSLCETEGTHTHVTAIFRRPPEHLLKCIGCPSNDPILTDDLPCIRNRHVTKPEMHPVCPALIRNQRIIIQNEYSSCFITKLSRLQRCCPQFI